jgi:hypothetical protein
MLGFAHNGFASSCAPSLTYMLTKNLIGNIEYGMGSTSYMKTTLEYLHETVKMSVACQLSVMNPFVSCSLSKSFQNDETIVQSTLRYGYMGLYLQYGITKKVTQFSFLDASILISNATGVFLNIK